MATAAYNWDQGEKMIMIDTLKLTKRLTAASMPTEQAEALSEGLAESLKESFVTREFLDARRAEDRAYLDTKFAETRSRLDTRLAALRTELVMWVVGTVGLATLLNHWWR